MQAFILIQDAFGGEVRIPVNVSIPVPANDHISPQATVPPQEPTGKGRWNANYSPEFRAKALELGQLMGAGKAARFLGIPDSTVDNWLRKAKPTAPRRGTSVTSWAVN